MSYTLGVILLAALFAATNANAEPQAVTGFTKIVDGSDDVPEAPGQPDPVDHFWDVHFFPSVNHSGMELSHDGVKTAFIGCTANATNSACEQNEFGLYYHDGTSLNFIRDYQSSNGVAYSASIGGDTVSWVECFVSFGCAFQAGMQDLSTNNAFHIVSGFIWPATNLTGDHIIYGTGNSVVRYRVANNSHTTIADTSTLVPDEDTFFSSLNASAISATFLAFRGEGNSGVKGIFTNDNSDNVITVATTGMPLPEKPASSFTDFDTAPVISGTDVVFVGYGSGGEHRVYRNNGTTNTVLFSFTELGITPMQWINFHGDTVLFGDAGATNKLYLWNDGDLTPVIQSGDMLDGKTVDELDVPRGALADGSFAFPVRFTDGTVAIYVAEFASIIPIPATVEIDVDPWSSANIVKPNSDNPIVVAIMGSSTGTGDATNFDANQVDPASLKFGVGEAPNIAVMPFIADFDGDTNTDTAFGFGTQAAGIFCGDTEISLTGETFGGQAFTGTDSIDTTDCVTGSCHP